MISGTAEKEELRKKEVAMAEKLVVCEQEEYSKISFGKVGDCRPPQTAVKKVWARGRGGTTLRMSFWYDIGSMVKAAWTRACLSAIDFFFMYFFFSSFSWL